MQDNTALGRAFDAYGRATNYDDQFTLERSIRSLATGKYLEGKLTSDKQYEKLLAARLLAEVGDKSSVVPLVQALRTADSELLAQIVGTISHFDFELGRSLALQHVSHEDGRVRAIAAHVLAFGGRREDWPMLSKMLEDPNPAVRKQLIWLGNPPPKDDMEDDAFKRFLLKASGDDIESIRVGLCHRLSKESNIDALRLLFSMAYEDSSKDVRGLALGCIDSWYRKHYDRRRTPRLFG